MPREGRGVVASLRAWIAAVVLAATLAFAGFAALDGGVLGQYHDDALYVVVAKSLAEENGYRISSLPHQPAQTKYPFLYSYALSLIWKVDSSFPGNIRSLKAFNVVCLFATVLLTYLWFRGGESRPAAWALLCAFLVGAEPFSFSFLDFTVSDHLFTTLALLALLFFDRASRHRGTLAHAVLGGAIVSCGYLVRQAGACLILGGLVEIACARNRRAVLAYLGTVALFVAPWIVWRWSQAPPPVPLLSYYASYEASAPELAWLDPRTAAQIFAGNLLYVRDALMFVLFLAPAPWLTAAVLPLLIWGACEALPRQPAFAKVFLLSYGLLILSWPFPSGRYLLPLVPFLACFLVEGLRKAALGVEAAACATWFKHVARSFLVAVVAALLFLASAWLDFYLAGARPERLRLWLGWRANYGWDGFSETFAWIRENTQPVDVLATAYDPMYYLFTGRKSVRPWFHNPHTYFYPYREPRPDLGSVDAVRRDLMALGVRYLIIDPLDGYAEGKVADRHFRALLATFPGARRVFVSSDGRHEVYALGGEG